MSIFDSGYRTKWKIEWDAHCERVRAERLNSVDHYHEGCATVYCNYRRGLDAYHDEQRDLGYDDQRNLFKDGPGDYGWYWHDEDPQPVRD